MEWRRNFMLAIVVCIILSLSTGVQALSIVNFTQCGIDATAIFNEASDSTFLRDQYGHPTGNLSDAWGISYEACNSLCGANSEFIDWHAFLEQFTQWFLPWLALATYLPYPSTSILQNLSTLLLAIGSPILIIYSLFVTIFNARAINRAFREIEEDNEALKRPDLTKFIRSTRTVVIGSQSYSLQLIKWIERHLDQLVVDPGNWQWWRVIAVEFMVAIRGWTYSMIYSLLLAVCGLCFHIVDYLNPEHTNSTLRNGFGIISLWLWLIPVTVGWRINVGEEIRYFAKLVEGTLDSTAEPNFLLQGFLDGRAWIQDDTLSQRRTPLQVQLRRTDPTNETHSGKESSPTALLNRVHEATTLENNEKSIDPDPDAPVAPLFGFSVTGAESESGPIFNYARVWSYMNTVARIQEAFHDFTNRQKQKLPTDGTQPSYTEDWDANLAGALAETSKYISTCDKDGLLLPIRYPLLSTVIVNCFKAASVAVTLGGATIGGSLLITYMTPTVGLDCHSAVYLVYGVAATASWLLLTSSAYLSHLYLKRSVESLPHRSRGMSLLGPAAVYLRIFGKTLAFINACFIIVATILQLTNAYNNCWCSSAAMTLGTKNAWVVLFATDAQIVAVSKIPWLIGVLTSVVVVTVTLVFILRYTGESGDEKLPLVKEQLLQGMSRVRWKCACGENLYDDYKELRPGAAKELEKSLQQWSRSIRLRNYQSKTEKVTTWGTAIKNSLYLLGQQLKNLSRDQQPAIVQSQPRYYSEDRATRAPAQPSAEILYLLLCHNAGVGAEIVKLHQPDVCDIDSDQRFFQCLQDEYTHLRKRLWSWTSLWCLQSIKFAKFGLFADNVVDIRKLDEVPPQGRDHEYRFERPNPPDLEPPLGPKLLMHSFKHPECTGTGRRCLRMIPRRLNRRLELAADDSDIVGWGLQFVEGWSKKRLLYMVGVLCGLSSLLVLILISILGKNIQNAAAIAGFILALLTAGIATLQAAMYMT